MAKGSLLIESSIALVLLIAFAFVLLKGSIDIIKPRNWTIRQNITDAYLTYEEAHAKRVPFQNLIDGTAVWTAAATTENDVILGKTFGGTNVTGTVKRILVPDANNGNAATNPAQMETYTLYSVLFYQIGGVDYVKSRTIIRSR